MFWTTLVGRDLGDGAWSPLPFLLQASSVRDIATAPAVSRLLVSLRFFIELVDTNWCVTMGTRLMHRKDSFWFLLTEHEVWLL